MLGESREDLVGGDHAAAVPAVLRVERHLLDEAQLVAALHAPAQQRGPLVLVEAPQQHRVDLDGGEPGLGGGLEPGDDVVEAVAQRDPVEHLRVGGVEADVDPVEAGGGQRVGRAAQPEGVRGDGGARRPRHRLGGRDDRGQSATQQRLAAGEPHVDDAETRDGDVDQPDDLVVGEHLGRGHPVEPLGRHAVLAAQVAAVRQRDPQVGGHTSMSVTELHPPSLGARTQPRRSPLVSGG